VFFASAIFTLASPHKGASHHGTHLRAYAMSGTAGAAMQASDGPAAAPTGRGVVGLITSPRLEDLSHVVMSIAMGFLLVLML
jgi:hypothetical protein